MNNGRNWYKYFMNKNKNTYTNPFFFFGLKRKEGTYIG